MRVLVCGGRDYQDAARVFFVLDHYHAQRPFSVVIHGAATGADSLAGEWATSRGVPVYAFQADWNLHGGAAGPIRNAQMISEGKPNLVIAFPGGRGTRNMRAQARECWIDVLDIPPC